MQIYEKKFDFCPLHPYPFRNEMRKQMMVSIIDINENVLDLFYRWYDETDLYDVLKDVVYYALHEHNTDYFPKHYQKVKHVNCYYELNGKKIKKVYQIS